MSRTCRVGLLIAAWVAIASAGTAAADDLVRPFAPVDGGGAPRPAGVSVFSLAVSPQPPAQQERAVPGQPLDILPSREAIAAAVAAMPKLANVPLPPRIDRPQGAAPRATEGPGSAPAAVAAALPAPDSAKAGPETPAFFTWLTRQYEEPAAGDRQQVASLSPVISARRSGPAETPAPRDTPDDDDLEEEETRKMVEKQAPHVEISCLKPSLMRLIHAAGTHFKGTPVITSGFRDRGRRGSFHRKCAAADFFITGVSSPALTGFLRKLPGAGGVGTYCHTKSVHIDTGDPRDWHQCGFRRRFALRAPVVSAQNGSR